MALCDSDKDFSIAYDVTLATSPTSGNGSAYRFCALFDETFNKFCISFGKGTATSQGYSLQYMFQYSNMLTAGTGRHRFVIYHIKGSGKLEMQYRKDNGAVTAYTQSGTFEASHRALRLGANATSSALPKGVINNVTIYSRVLSVDEINDFLGVS